ncbi:MAG: hypothetical protein ABSF99_06935 [Anaerolineales bacterium]|jgi:hypothetical protein
MDELRKPLFDLPIIESEELPLSHYIRTSWMLSAEINLKASEFCEIRRFSAQEADKLAAQVNKRNVFARHSRENNFYVQRARELGDRSVIEIILPGDPKDITNEAEQIASILEKIAVLSSTIALNKDDLQRRLGISSTLRTDFDFVFSPNFYYLRSKSRKAPVCKGIIIDNRFCNRFFHCGFNVLVDYARSNTSIATRVFQSIDWLFDSRIEPRLHASIVKSSIALESLLIFSESESLANSLSERSAFILSSDPDKRQQISKIIKNFYDARSGVVHGGQKRSKKFTPELLESIDRLAIMSCLVIAANSTLWSTTEALREWCENQRWGEPSRDINIPFPDLYLRNAINLSQQG